ncbi:unnamed protein product [Urochloa humidicola]
MRWLTEGCGSGDSLVFQFAGHGVQHVDLKDDEVDGYNEALCPVDFEQSGNILDDEINETMVRPVGRAVKLHAIMDTGHSGTILDLPYLYRLSRTGYWQWENGGLEWREREVPEWRAGHLHQRLQRRPEVRGHQRRGRRTRDDVRRLLSRGCPGRLGSYVRRMTASSGVQEPQLCSSEMFDIYRKPFLL